jgi:hypothetical protein
MRSFVDMLDSNLETLCEDYGISKVSSSYSAAGNFIILLP